MSPLARQRRSARQVREQRQNDRTAAKHARREAKVAAAKDKRSRKAERRAALALLEKLSVEELSELRAKVGR